MLSRMYLEQAVNSGHNNKKNNSYQVRLCSVCLYLRAVEKNHSICEHNVTITHPNGLHLPKSDNLSGPSGFGEGAEIG